LYDRLLAKASSTRSASTAPPADTPRVDFTRITSAELASGNYDVEFAIEGALVLAQPLIVAGPMKVLKTSFIVDAAVSLASAGYFLGRFKVNRSRRVAVMSGESGLGTLQETALRISDSAGVRLPDCGNLIWSPDIPKIADSDHLDALDRFLTGDDIEVLFLDPAYLAMPSADAGNLMAQGELLRNISEVCQRLGVTLILAHHAKRNVSRDIYEPMELQDISWAGYAEFARQWWLISRRERYVPGTGDHKLWLSIGGSAGHSSLWAANVNEGVRTDPGGRRWEVELLDAAEAREAAAQRKADDKVAEKEKQLEAERKAVCRVLVKHPTGLSKTAIGTAAGIHHRHWPALFAAMLEYDEIEYVNLSVGNNNRAVEGYKLKAKEQ
jgi:hypothetical protein